MTKEEILAMVAGRELDALVAEVIFGYRVYRYTDRDWQTYSPGLRGSVRRMHKYSQTMSAAWRVVEEVFTIMGRRLHLHQDLDDDWWARFGHGGMIADGKTAPEAICKAALVAKLEGV